MKVFDATPGASGKDGAAIVAPEQSTPASAKPDASAGTSPESGVGTHTESPSRSPGGGEPPAAKTELADGHGGAESAHSIGIAEGSAEANGTRTAELTDAASPWYRRPSILIAAAALIAEVGIVVSGAGRSGHRAWRHNRDEHPVVGELLAHDDRFLGTATGTPTGATPSGGTPTGATPNVGTPSVGTPSGGTASSTSSSASSATGAGVEVRQQPPGDDAFVSIINNDKPAVGCMFRSVAVAGTATMSQLHAGLPLHRNRLGGDADRS